MKGMNIKMKISTKLKKLFSKKNKEISPSRKLCNAIQRDYWGCDDNGQYLPLGKKGFLDREFCINEKTYSTVSSDQSNVSIKITVKDADDKDVFRLTLLYGEKEGCDNEHIIYIERFQRLSEHSCGIGSEMARFIRELAENYGFKIIGVHPCATINEKMGYMSQEKLKEFYERHLNSDHVKLEFMRNSDCIKYINYGQVGKSL